MAEIYYIEDDISIAQIVKEYLEQKDFRVFIYATISEAKSAMLHQTPGLVLVDWNMPDGQGDQVCNWIRTKWQKLPVIILTVRDDSSDIVSGFLHGADDYVVKPFELKVLHSRICALLRRTGDISGQPINCDRISLDQNRLMVFLNGEEVSLSQAEYSLLLILMKNKGKTVTRECLLEQIWDCNGSFVNDNTLTVTMKRLREKLHHPSCMKTIRSFGYRMEDTQ